MAGQVLLAFCTFPDSETARRVVREIVETRLAACGNILPQVESIYHWQGKLESNAEALALFKLTSDCYENFEKRLRSLHPYDVPEIVTVSVANALPEYLRWVIDNCS